MQAPLIILSTLQSHACLVGAMLGRHPGLQDLPPTNLWVAETVDAWLALEAEHHQAMQGLIYALAQGLAHTQSEKGLKQARAWLDQRRNWHVDQVYALLAEQAGEKMLVDASPWLPLRPEYLERLVRMHPEASFLHLTRHPATCLPAMTENPQDYQDAGALIGERRIDPEDLWVRAHQNITSFCEALPPGQCMLLKAEDLLGAPELYLGQIAEWLGISMTGRSVKAMLQPERSPYGGLYPEGVDLAEARQTLPARPKGRGKASAALADIQWSAGRGFAKPTLKLAKQFGYA